MLSAASKTTLSKAVFGKPGWALFANNLYPAVVGTGLNAAGNLGLGWLSRFKPSKKDKDSNVVVTFIVAKDPVSSPSSTQ